MQSKVKTVVEYINSLPAERQKPIIAIRKAIKQNLPKGFEETMSYGMIGYVVPLKLYKDGYHCNPELPLPFINLASQKNFIALYHMGMYVGNLLKCFQDEWKAYTKQKLDMGKACIRFKKLDDIPYDLIGTLASKLTPQQWIEHYEKAIKARK